MTSPRGYRATIRQRLLDLREVEGCLRNLDAEQPDAVSRALARYLTVRAVGYVEAIRDDLADLYAATNGHPRLHRRITHHLRTGHGVAPEQLLSFVGSFDPAWRESLESLLDAEDQDLRSKLGAMVAARKKIAHGDGEQVTTGRALAWAATAQVIGKYLTSLFAPSDDGQGVGTSQS
ncbi:MAG: hypothetical protein LC776_15510 [Acidobacteria bacterium]|nr:hypothetical protein [Acidobacteriota bacterium]